MRTLFLFLAAVVAGAQAPPPPPPPIQFTGARQDYVRMARSNLGIVRYAGLLPGGALDQFRDDITNSAVLWLAGKDQAALDRYSSAMGTLAALRWGVEPSETTVRRLVSGAMLELLCSYEMMREHVGEDLRRRVDAWLLDWAHARAARTAGGDGVARQLELASVAVILRLPPAAGDPLLLSWAKAQAAAWARREWSLDSPAAGSPWDAVSLWQISRLAGQDQVPAKSARRFFESHLLLLAPNGARPLSDAVDPRDSTAAVFALGAHLLKDGRYKLALNRQAEFSLDRKFRFPFLDLIWRFSDDALPASEPRRRSVYISEPQDSAGRIVFRDGWNQGDDAYFVFNLLHDPRAALHGAQAVGPFIWRDTPWLIDTAVPLPEAGLESHRWQSNALLVREGTGQRAAGHLKDAAADLTSAPVAPSDVLFEELGLAAFGRSRMNAAGFAQTRAVWHLERGYTVVFDSAQAVRQGVFTLGAAWHTAQQVRLRAESELLLEDGVENRFSLHWFSSRPIETTFERRRWNTPADVPAYYGAGREVADLFQTVAGGFSAGERWTLLNVLLPRRSLTVTVREIPVPAAAAAVEIGRPETVDLVAVSFEEGGQDYGAVSSDAAALLVRRSRKFAGPVLVHYAGGRKLEIQTGLAPSAVLFRSARRQPWYIDEPASASEVALGTGQWRFQQGRLSVDLPQSSGELRVMFPPVPAPAGLK